MGFTCEQPSMQAVRHQVCPSLAAVWIKMVITVSAGIALLQFHIDHALADHLFCGFLMTGSLFLFRLAGHADDGIVKEGEYSQIPGSQLLAALGTLRGTTDFVFPVQAHRTVPPLSKDIINVVTFTRK
jgi:uncharacterized membrane protein